MTAPDFPAAPTGESTTEDVVARVLANGGNRAAGYQLFGGGRSGVAERTDRSDPDGDQFDREDRQALRRVAGLSTELHDVTEVEYRQLRLENVILIGVYATGTATDA